jgi:hypothetical protein
MEQGLCVLVSFVEIAMNFPITKKPDGKKKSTKATKGTSAEKPAKAEKTSK